MGYVYKFTIRETGKWYIGSHCGNKKGYLGSGLAWQAALKKYGIDSFDREILYEGDNYRAEEERILKQLDAANDSMSYNLKNEAMGGSFPGKLNGMYGKKLSDEQKYKCGSGFRGKTRPDHSQRMSGDGNPMFGRNDHCDALIAKSKLNKGKSFDEIYGAENSEKIKQKIGDAHRGSIKPYVSAAQSGGKNSSAKPIEYKGVRYECIKDAMIALNLSRYVIKKDCIEL